MKSDNQIKLDVAAEIEWKPSVHAARIGIEVMDGLVTLAGDVGGQFQRQAASVPCLRGAFSSLTHADYCAATSTHLG